MTKSTTNSTTVSHLKREGGRKPTTGGVLSDRHAGNAGPGLAVIQAKLRGGPGHACILPPASREGQESREKGEAGDMTVRAAPFCWVPCCTGRCGRSGSRGAETGQLGGRPGRCHPCRPCGPGRVQEWGWGGEEEWAGGVGTGWAWVGWKAALDRGAPMQPCPCPHALDVVFPTHTSRQVSARASTSRGCAPPSLGQVRSSQGHARWASWPRLQGALDPSHGSSGLRLLG